MPPDIRAFDGDATTYMRAVTLPFGFETRDEDMAVFAPLVELDRALAAYDAEQVVGTAAAFSMQLTIPDGELPMAGVTMVGVHPTHRRRGLLRQMMRRQLDDIHERGEALAGLWASEAVIYQRFGYGLASLAASFEIDRARTAFRRPHQASGTLRLVNGDEVAEASRRFSNASSTAGRASSRAAGIGGSRSSSTIRSIPGAAAARPRSSCTRRTARPQAMHATGSTPSGTIADRSRRWR